MILGNGEVSMRSNLGTVIAIACALFGVTCKRTASEEHADATVAAAVVPTRGVVRVSGSSALLPLLNVAKESFEEAHPGMSVEVSAGGSQKGLADVASGAVEIGASDIEAPDALRGALLDHRIAVVGIAAVAHKGP
jgi:phosphate transport system substrate-binding protein